MNVYIGKPIVISDMQGPCDDGFHIPTETEWTTLYNAGLNLGAWTSSNCNNVKDYLKIPFPGILYNNTGTLGDAKNFGGYWCSTSKNTYYGASIGFNINQAATIGINYRARGLSIRPFKDTPVVPDSSWTALYSDKIYHNSTLGLISLSSDGTNWITIADKNLGATTVYNNGNVLSQANCGNFYQWGNNYGFAYTSATKTSYTLVNATGYGPGNYYSSDTFILNVSSPYDWSSNNNNNLRGGVSQGSTTKNVELKNAYIGEYVEEITETYTMSNISGGTRIWTSNLYKSGYKIIKIVQEGTITCTSSNEARQGIFNDTSQTLGMQSYYGFNAYRNAPEAIEKHYNNTWYRMQTLSSSYYSTTVNFRRETTATQIKTSYNGNTMTYDLTSEEVGWFKPILEGNSVYCTSQISNYGVSPLGTISTVTVTVTYEKI